MSFKLSLSAVAVLLLCSVSVSSAQSYRYAALIDRDASTSTGCTVAGVAGIEATLTAVASGTPIAVTALELQVCSGGGLDAVQDVGAGYPIGFDDGVGGADVVELGVAASLLGPMANSPRITFTSSGAAGSDSVPGTLAPGLGGGSGPGTPVEPIYIPLLSAPALAVLALLLAIIVLWIGRRHPGAWVLLLLVGTLGGAGLVWAANHMLDGQIGDWTVGPLVNDPVGDGSGDPALDIVAGFAARESETLFFRIDIADIEAQNVAPTIAPQAFVVQKPVVVGAVVGTVVANDPDVGQALQYALLSGNAAGAFALDSASGVLTVADEVALVAQPSHALTIEVSDDGSPSLSATAVITVSVIGLTGPPVITSPAAASASENQTVAALIAAIDPDDDAISFAISGGADAALFAINGSSGALSFNSAPDFEAPADADSDNVYAVTVQASASDGSGSQTLAISVTNVDEAPVFTSAASLTHAENTTAVGNVLAVDPENGGVSYSISGGADAALFTVDSASGALSFNSAPDFDKPADADGNNIYALIVAASDGSLSATQALDITVVPTSAAPEFTSTDTASVAENTLAVLTVTATDPDGDTLSFAINGGADAALFAIDASSGALTFNTAPDFEAPADADGNNQYQLIVQVSDGGNTPTQALTVTVTNVDEAPVFSSAADSSVAENGTTVSTVIASDPEGVAISYSLVGAADAGLFTIDAGTGALAFAAGPDFEAPADADTDNVYLLTVQASDGSTNTTQALSVTVTDVNETPAFTSAASVNVAENTTAALTVSAADPENAALSFAIIGGADAALFAINASSGALTFNAAPDFEAPADADSDNVYAISVQVGDGVFSPTQAINVTVTDADEAPVFTSAAAASLVENTTAVTTVVAVDPDGATVSYSVSGGVDGALFAIDADTGALSFITAPDFDVPADAGADNVYDVVVSASDGSQSATQALVISVTEATTPPEFTSADSASVAENTTAVTTVTATDADGDTLSFSIIGGSDAALFAIDAASGALTFNTAPDFEAPADADGNNQYQLTVQVSDGGITPTQALTVSVTNVDEAPVFSSAANPSVAENGTAVTTVVAADPEGVAISYSLVGGADAGLFTIDAGTGALAFSTAPDFEAPADAGTDNVYLLTVQASDGSTNTTQALSVAVTDVNETPTFSSAASVNVAENSTAALTVSAADPESDSLSFSITGGADAGLFSINANSGALSFSAAPDFEVPGDAGGDNVYDVVVAATDGSNSPTQAIAVSVTDVNEAPSFTSAASANVMEGTTAVLTVTTSDQEGNTVTYSITGGADMALFAIDANSGALSFDSAPDFETPADAGGDNVYDVIVTATDGSNSPTQAIAVSVTNFSEAPSFTSSATPSVAENSTAVLTVTTSDPEADTITYSVSGGADMALFAIDANSGALSFSAAPDFETPTDAGTDNVYDVIVTATDGSNSPTQAIAVSVTDVNEAPSFTSAASANVTEGTTAVLTVTTSDQEGNTVTYSITGGADLTLFAIDANSGALTFVSAPDFEAPADVGVDNIYDVIVTATDGSNSPTQAIAVTVTDANETPSFTSAATVNVAENSTAVLTVTTSDPETNTVTYSVTGGADMALFAIDANSGALSFSSAQDFETPADVGTDNVYDVIVTATDGSNSPTQAIAVSVTNVNEAPSFTSAASANVAEGTTAVLTVTSSDQEGNTVTYSITGGADLTLFAIDANSGALTFVSAPDFEAPADVGVDNVYDVVVTANDGSNSPTQAIAVTVTDANEAPSFTSAATVNVAENSTAVLTVTTSDPEAATVTYSVTGGADMALFAIDANSGALTFSAAPDFETALDAGGNNVYNVIVTATDGSNSPTQAIAVTVTDVNETPVFTSSAAPSIAENTTAVLSVTTTDPEVDTVTYSVSGGADMALFAIDANSGALTFSAAPDFETALDAGGNNVYNVIVTATDGSNSPTQAIAVTVTDANEAPSFTSAATANVAENSTAVLTVTTSDPETDTVTYSVSGGADMALFAIDTNSGALSFSAAPDFEVPGDAGGDNVYNVIVTATDGSNSPTQAIAVTVTDVDEAPAFTSSATPSVAENTTAVITVVADDPESVAISYSIVGGADSALFSIDGSSGDLTFNTAPNFEAPGDAGPNNVYNVDVQATDGSTPITQNIAVSVTDANEAPILDDQTRAIDENSGNGSNVGAVLAFTEPDAGQSHGFAITAGNTGTAFAISNTGQITVANSAQLNHEAVQSFTLTVAITDDGTPPLNDTATITIDINDVNEAPTAGADAYSYVGNTELRIDGHAGGGATTLASTSVTTNLLDNDTDPDTLNAGFSTLTAVAASGTTVNGSRYAIATDGTMVFTPGPGYTGSDVVNYSLSDGTNTVGGAITFTLTGTDVVWYVRNNNASGNSEGTSTHPFTTLAAAATASDVNEIVYVHVGDGSTTGQNAGITLQNGQKLIGNGVALVVNTSTSLINAGTQPLIGNSGGVGVTATDLSGVQIRGLDIAASTDAVFVSTTAGNSGGIEIADNTISAAGTEGIDIDGGGSGTLTVSLHDNTITATGTAIDILRSAGTVAITAFDDNSVHGNSGTAGIVVSGAVFDASASAGFQTVSGGNTVVGASGNGVGGAGITLANVTGDLSFTGLNVYAGGGNALLASGSGVFNAGSGTGLQIVANSGTDVLQAVGGRALDLANVTINLTPNQITSSNSPTGGLQMSTVAGTFTAGASSTISNVTAGGGFGYRITGSSVNATYNGTITQTQGTGVSLTTNTGTYAFTGALSLSTATNPAFVATSSGTVTSTNTTSTLTTTTAAALNVASTTIGAADLSFRSISSNGASSGIVLNNTGAIGGLVVTGTGGNNSGGIIQNTSGDGISLITTRNVSLSEMRVASSDGSNIDASSVTNLTLDSMELDSSMSHGFLGNNITNLVISGGTYNRGGADAEPTCNLHGVEITNLLGTSSVTDATFTRSNTIQFHVVNSAATNNPDTLTVSGTTWGTHTGPCSGDHLSVAADTGGNFKLITNENSGENNMQGGGTGVQVAAQGGGTMQASITGVETSGNTAGVVVVATATSNISFNVFGNNTGNGTGFSGTGSVALILTCTTSGVCQGAFDDNSITHTAGTSTNAMQVVVEGNGTGRVNVVNNVVSGNFQRGLHAQSRAGTGTLALHVTSNAMTQTDTNGLQVMNFEVGASGGGTTNALCLNLASNNATPAGANQAYRLFHRTGYTYQLQNLAQASTTNTADVQTWVSTTKSNAGTPVGVTIGTSPFTTTASCAAPTLPSP